MSQHFDTMALRRELDALTMAQADNLARAYREAEMIRAGTAGEKMVHDAIRGFTAALDQTNAMKAALITKLIAHRAPQYAFAPPIEKRHTLSHHINKLRERDRVPA